MYISSRSPVPNISHAAQTYCSAFDELILHQKEEFFFRGRSRRPPLDNVNALLSFLYVLLAHDIASALETTALEPAVGFLHRDRPGRAGLGSGPHGGNCARCWPEPNPPTTRKALSFFSANVK